MIRRRGFTLIEMLIVIIIIIILASVLTASMSMFFRGQGVRQGTQQVIMAFAQARQLAATRNRIYFVVFHNDGDSGTLEIHENTTPDTDPDPIYGGDFNLTTEDSIDPAVGANPVGLPRNVFFMEGKYPPWVGIRPTGTCFFPDTFNPIGASDFDGNAAQADPLDIGDIVLEAVDQPHRMCLDLDRSSGKIRRWFYRMEKIEPGGSGGGTPTGTPTQ